MASGIASKFDDFFNSDNCVSSFSREKAIEDGILVDVSGLALQVGFKFPVALTRAVYVDCVEWGEEEGKRKPQASQEEKARLWDVLWMAHVAAKNSKKKSRIIYELHRVPAQGSEVHAQLVRLVMDIGPGDNCEPVIRISLPDEN